VSSALIAVITESTDSASTEGALSTPQRVATEIRAENFVLNATMNARYPNTR
jgi:hypothetical protein